VQYVAKGPKVNDLGRGMSKPDRIEVRCDACDGSGFHRASRDEAVEVIRCLRLGFGFRGSGRVVRADYRPCWRRMSPNGAYELCLTISSSQFGSIANHAASDRGQRADRRDAGHRLTPFPEYPCHLPRPFGRAVRNCCRWLRRLASSSSKLGVEVSSCLALSERNRGNRASRARRRWRPQQPAQGC
jgi:hypothetical protein